MPEVSVMVGLAKFELPTKACAGESNSKLAANNEMDKMPLTLTHLSSLTDFIINTSWSEPETVNSDA